jgi:hypothetical protein
LKTWEIVVEIPMRTTLHFSGPKTEKAARVMVGLIMAGEIGDIAAFVKWGDGRGSCRPVPMPTIVDSNPAIVAVRDVSGGGA